MGIDTVIRRATLLVVLWGTAVASAVGHPHDGEPVVLKFHGRVTEVNLARHTLAFDAIDPETRRPRNYLVFLDAKVKVSRGHEKKIPLTELTNGQSIVCFVEVEANPDSRSRMVVFEIRFDLQARPAIY